MFRNLRPTITPLRRLVAFLLLALLLAVGLWVVKEKLGEHTQLVRIPKALFWAVIAVGGLRLFAFLLLDPLLRHRKTETPGFARDLILVALYAAAGVEILRVVVQVDVVALLGTGAIVAAVVGLSLQETLGNLFAGIALHLDPAFRVGDWVEVTGNLRGGEARDTFIGQVMAITWRSVQMRTENGDTDVFPNRTIAQAVVTNLYAPAGYHRRIGRLVLEPHPDLHMALEKLAVALGGIPHDPEHRPEAVVRGYVGGGASVEMRWWSLGFRHSRAGQNEAFRLAMTVLPREGFSVMGPCAPNAVTRHGAAPREQDVAPLVARFNLPTHWGPELMACATVRRVAPGEGVIRKGDPGQSLFVVLRGSLRVVRPVVREAPYTGLFWEEVARLEADAVFGEASLLTGTPRSATVVADTACDLLEVPKEAFARAFEKEPALMEGLAHLMESRAAQAPVPAEGSDDSSWLGQIRRWFHLKA